jgi:hypothetical protein
MPDDPRDRQCRSVGLQPDVYPEGAALAVVGVDADALHPSQSTRCARCEMPTASSIVEAMANEVRSLTKDKQHLGMYMNYDADLFVANRL